MFNFLKSNKINWLWATSLILVLLLSSVLFHAFNRNFYYETFKKYEIEREIGISQQDLNKSNNKLLDYLLNQTDSLDVKVTLNGNQVPMFNEKEISHMKDVKTLSLATIIGCVIFGLIFILFTIYHLVKNKKEALFLFDQSFNSSIVVFMMVFALIGLVIIADFDFFWTQFHHVFFRNDLWLLDPTTDRLIQMMPLNLFYDLVSRIFVTFIGLLLLIKGGLMYATRKKSAHRAI